MSDLDREIDSIIEELDLKEDVKEFRVHVLDKFYSVYLTEEELEDSDTIIGLFVKYKTEERYQELLQEKAIVGTH